MLDYIVSVLAQVVSWLCSPMVKPTKYACVAQPGKPLILFISKQMTFAEPRSSVIECFGRFIGLKKQSTVPATPHIHDQGGWNFCSTGNTLRLRQSLGMS